MAPLDPSAGVTYLYTRRDGRLGTGALAELAAKFKQPPATTQTRVMLQGAPAAARPSRKPIQREGLGGGPYQSAAGQETAKRDTQTLK